MKHYQQSNKYGCGEACLKMILSYFAKEYIYDKEIIHNSFFDIKKYLKKENILSESYKAFCSLNDILFKISIIQIKTLLGYHFVVLERQQTELIVYDPLKVKETKNIKKYLRKWTGKILIIETEYDII